MWHSRWALTCELITKVFWKGPLREDIRNQQIQTVENFAKRGAAAS